jgi:hypothetical protein
VREQLECRNVLEGYILEMKGVPNRKHGQVVDRAALLTALEVKENWLWDHGETASLLELQQEVGAPLTHTPSHSACSSPN